MRGGKCNRAVLRGLTDRTPRSPVISRRHIAIKVKSRLKIKPAFMSCRAKSRHLSWFLFTFRDSSTSVGMTIAPDSFRELKEISRLRINVRAFQLARDRAEEDFWNRWRSRCRERGARHGRDCVVTRPRCSLRLRAAEPAQDPCRCAPQDRAGQRHASFRLHVGKRACRRNHFAWCGRAGHWAVAYARCCIHHPITARRCRHRPFRVA